MSDHTKSHNLNSNHQLALSLTLPDNALLDTYYPGNNFQALEQVKKAAKGQDEFFIYLWGSEGAGCSHLLQGACGLASDFNRSAMYLPLAQLHPQGPGVLSALEQLDLVCIDDIQAIAGNKEWEEALFHLYNRIRDTKRAHCIIAGARAPKNAGIQLPDLQSRLAWGVTYHLHPLGDEDKFKALQLRAKMRGLELPEDVGNFILRRAARNMGELYHLLELLDEAAMKAKRRLTIPFVKSLGLF